MASPGITLNATLQDVTGALTGSAQNPSKIAIALCGYGPFLPRIAGTSMLARVGPIYIESSNGNFTTLLWGNDVITPAGTYYTISLLDGQGNVVQTGAYQFTGTGTYDLSSFPPIAYPGTGGTVLPMGMQTWSHNVTLAEGGNTTYTLPLTPYAGLPFLLFRSGMLLQQGSPPFGSYTLSGNTVTFNVSTEVGDSLYAIYWFFS